MNKKNIRVLHIDSEYGWRGGQQQAAYLLEHMYGKGYSTALVCQPKSDIEAYCRDKNLTYFPMRMHGEMDILAGFRIARLCRKERFNILHLHSAHALATGLWVKLFCHKVKLIGVRRVDFHIRDNPVSRFKYTNSMLDKIVCISNQIKNVLLLDGIPEHLLTTIHSGVDLHKFEHVVPSADFRKTLGVSGGHILIGTVAAMAGHKDYPNLLRAARIVLDRTEDVTFCAVGDGPKEDEIRSLARELRLGSRFIFTGFRKDVGNFLKSFDIFVLSSHLEGLGTSILDAQAVGLPVIGCKTGGIPEVVQNNINGLLVPPKDSEALAEAILDLVKNETKRKEFGKKGRATVTRFAIENTVQENLNLYDQLMESATQQLCLRAVE